MGRYVSTISPWSSVATHCRDSCRTRKVSSPKLISVPGYATPHSLLDKTRSKLTVAELKLKQLESELADLKIEADEKNKGRLECGVAYPGTGPHGRGADLLGSPNPAADNGPPPGADQNLAVAVDIAVRGVHRPQLSGEARAGHTGQRGLLHREHQLPGGWVCRFSRT